MRSFIVAVLSALAFMPMQAYAQEEEAVELQGALMNLHGVLTFPQAEFGEKLDRVGAGFGLDLGYAPPWLPVAAGVSGNMSWYSSETTDVYVDTDRYRGWMPLGADGKLFTVYIFARLQPHTGVFRPFVEGLTGLNILWMDSSVEDDEYKDLGFSGANDLTDVGLGYGAGGGLEFRVYSGANNSDQYSEAYVSLRVRYLYGSRMEYLQAEAISFDEEGKPFVRSEDRMRSDIEMLQVMVGITGRL